MPTCDAHHSPLGAALRGLLSLAGMKGNAATAGLMPGIETGLKRCEAYVSARIDARVQTPVVRVPGEPRC